MDIKIYAGTVNQYYTDDWILNEDDKESLKIVKVTSKIENNDNHYIQEMVANWEKQILQSISNIKNNNYPSWSEIRSDYLTARFIQEAYSALIMYSASLIYHLPFPEIIKSDTSLENHDLVQMALNDEKYNWSLFNGTTCWLPINEQLTFYGPNPTGQTIVIATTGTLLNELKHINHLGWNGNERSIINWYKFEKKQDEKSCLYNTEFLAKQAFSILYQTVAFANKNNVPILLSY